jgi:hypothetical protein
MRRLLLGGLVLVVIGVFIPQVRATTGPSIPARGTQINAGNAATVQGAYRDARGRWVVPLRSARPAWVTDQLLAAARNGPVAAPSAAAADLPVDGLVGIRPGSDMIAPNGCTMNFIFKNAAGALGIGTAGHCVNNGDHVVLLTLAPGAGNPVLVDIGTVAVRVFNPNNIAPDFAIVQINPALYNWVFPTIAQILGPCGVYAGSGLASIPLPQIFQQQASTLGPDLLAWYGDGAVVATDTGVVRTGLAMYWESQAYYWTGPGLPGDSGSPVRTSSFAGAGNLTDMVIDTSVPGALMEGTRLTTMQSLSGWSVVSGLPC